MTGIVGMADGTAGETAHRTANTAERFRVVVSSAPVQRRQTRIWIDVL